jgi:hypothetical protein
LRPIVAAGMIGVDGDHPSGEFSSEWLHVIISVLLSIIYGFIRSSRAEGFMARFDATWHQTVVSDHHNQRADHMAPTAAREWQDPSEEPTMS